MAIKGIWGIRRMFLFTANAANSEYSCLIFIFKPHLSQTCFANVSWPYLMSCLMSFSHTLRKDTLFLHSHPFFICLEKLCYCFALSLFVIVLYEERKQVLKCSTFTSTKTLSTQLGTVEINTFNISQLLLYFVDYFYNCD